VRRRTVFADPSTFFYLGFFFRFYLLPIPRYSRFSCGPLLLRRCRLEARAKTGMRIGKRIGTNLSGIGENRANPRTTRRWTTWRYVALGIAAPQVGRGRETADEPGVRGDREEISFSRNPANEHGPYKALPLVRYSESASIVLVLSPVGPVAFGSVKKTCFCARGSDIAN